ncbi:MAG: hypothetical protein INH41_22890 [Myxococcaceae bacterium]|nr:hypothetical protein [Myxococcaceae bacterium]MCA3015246.1 hypothetical protein [Myxococcaceae bacterium]
MGSSAASGLWRLVTLVLVASACGQTDRTVLLSLGAPCVPGDSTTACRDGLCIALDDKSGFCTSTCVDTCPEGFACESAGRYGRICRALTGCKTSVDCPAGHTCNAETGNCFIQVSRAVCSPCQDVAQCPAGGACFTALGSGERFCTAPCGAADACPAGTTCREVPAGANNALVKQCVPPNETCNAGRPLCSVCTGDDECGGPYDLCVRNVVSGEQFCGRDCNPAKNVCPTPGCDPARLDAAQNPECPSGFSCVDLKSPSSEGGRGPYQCVPNSNTCAGSCDPSLERGQLSSQCGVGRLCQAGTCQPAVDGRQCAPCSTNDDCRRGGFSENRCIVNTCQGCPFRGESFCSTPCLDDAACVRSYGTGFVCKDVTDPTGPTRRYCMPQRGSCKGGLRRLGEDCNARGAFDCLSGVCVKAGLSAFCSNTCATDQQCGDPRFRCCEATASGYDCAPEKRSADGPVSGTGVCAPFGGLFGDDCTPGRPPCQSGTCLDLGTTRVCSLPCPTGQCPTGFSCRRALRSQAADQALDVCFPSGGGTAGASCAFGPAGCESGLCIRKDSGPVCTQPCTAEAECPMGWRCEALATVDDRSVQACLPPALQE